VLFGAARHVTHQQERDDHRGKRHGVNHVRPADIGRGDHDAAERRAEHLRRLLHDGVQADGIG
jgi:hypothetical protein